MEGDEDQRRVEPAETDNRATQSLANRNLATTAVSLTPARRLIRQQRRIRLPLPVFPRLRRTRG